MFEKLWTHCISFFSLFHITSSSPLQGNKLQTLKCICSTFVFMLLLFLIFRNTWKPLVKHPDVKSELKRSLLQITTKATLLDCTPHETEAAPNYCAIYKLTYISIQPLCPVCLPVICNRQAWREAHSWGFDPVWQILSTVNPFQCPASDVIVQRTAKASATSQPAVIYLSLGSERTQISSQPS